jgi:hypothetical protein
VLEDIPGLVAGLVSDPVDEVKPPPFGLELDVLPDAPAPVPSEKLGRSWWLVPPAFVSDVFWPVSAGPPRVHELDPPPF